MQVAASADVEGAFEGPFRLPSLPGALFQIIVHAFLERLP